MEVLRSPLSASQKGKLISAGYTSINLLSSVSLSHLALELKIPEAEALEILKTVSDSSRSETTSTSHTIVKGAQSAWDMLQEEETLIRITTSSSDFDNILGGGISCKEVTEIGGVPGIGKTQLGIQLAVNVQIPFDYGGLGGKAIYIDTEGSFMVERALQIAEACGDDMAEYSRLYRKGHQSHEVKIQPQDFLENIFYFRVYSYTKQIALINYLDKFITDHKDVKVVIIGSITFHFRQDDDMALRTRWWNGFKVDETCQKNWGSDKTNYQIISFYMFRYNLRWCFFFTREFVIEKIRRKSVIYWISITKCSYQKSVSNY